MGGEFVPLLVDIHTALTHKPTSATEANCLAVFALVAHWLVTRADFLEGILDVKQVVDVEGSLEACNSAHCQWRLLATVWACNTLSSTPYQRLEALLAKHVETLEQLWLCVGLQTYPTGDLFLDLVESFLSSSGGFCSHGYVDKLEGLVKAEASGKQVSKKANNTKFSSGCF